MEKKKTWILKILTGFFAVMLLCTVLSRAAATAVVPQVTTGKIKEGKLAVHVEGNGTIGIRQTQMVAVPWSARVRETKSVGEKVEKGEVILAFDLEDLEAQMTLKKAEVQKMRLFLEQQEVSGTADARVSASESAAREWNHAQEALRDARAELEDAKKDAKKGKAKLKQSLEKARQAAKAEKRAAKEAAEQELAEAREAYQKQQTKPEGVEPEHKETENQETAGDETERTAEENGVAQRKAAEEALALAEETYRQKLAAAEEACEQAIAEAEQTYQTALTELQGNQAAASEKADAMQDASSRAQDALDLAGMQDAADAQNQGKTSRVQELERRSTKIDLELLEEELDRLKKLIEEKGEIAAPESGVIQKNPLEAGATATGSDVILLGYGGWQMKGTVDAAEFSKMREGDEIEVFLAGRETGWKTEIGMLKMEDDAGSFTAELEGEGFSYGTEVSYVLEKDSESSYKMKIPLSALRQDDKGTYCLVMEEGSTVLGKEYTARRVNVTVEEKDALWAAVAGNLSPSDLLITGSNKQVSEGDRVRNAE